MYCGSRGDVLPIESASATSGSTPSNGILSAGSKYWAPSSHAANQRLTFTFDEPKYITGISTRGRPVSSYFVKEFELEMHIPEESSETGQSTNSNGFYNYKKFRSSVVPQSFVGNVNGNLVVYNKLPFPILASRISIKPTAWSSQINLAAAIHGYSPLPSMFSSLDLRPSGTCLNDSDVLERGENGGPGTVLGIDSFGSKLLVNNLGLNTILPLVKNEDSLLEQDDIPCDVYDLHKSGGFAWLLDDPLSTNDAPSWVTASGSSLLSVHTKFESILVREGGHLVCASSDTNAISLSADELTGDNSTTFHVAKGSTYSNRETMAVATFVYKDGDTSSNLILAPSTNIIKRSVTVWGKLHSPGTAEIEFGEVSGSRFTLAFDPDSQTFDFHKLVVSNDSEVFLTPKYPKYVNMEFEDGYIMPLYSGDSCGGKFLNLLGKAAVIEVKADATLYSPCRCRIATESRLVAHGKMHCGPIEYTDSVSGLEETDNSFMIGDLEVGPTGVFHFLITDTHNKLKAFQEIDVSGEVLAVSHASNESSESDPTKFNIKTAEIRIREGGSLKWQEPIVTDGRQMSIETSQLEVNGILSAGGEETRTSFSPIDRITFGSSGSAELTLESDLAVDYLDVGGKLHFRNYIQIIGKLSERAVEVKVTGPSGDFQVGNNGVASSTGLDHIKVHADEVTISGKFIANAFTPGDNGWRSLTIEDGGLFDFESAIACNTDGNSIIAGIFYVNTLSCKGTMIVRGAVTFESRRATSFGRMDSFEVLENGNITFVTNNETLDETCSGLSTFHIRSVDVTVNGYFYASTLKIDPGWDQLNMGQGSIFHLTPAAEFRIGKINTDGLIRTQTPLLLRGLRYSLVQNINIGVHGEILLNAETTLLDQTEWVKDSVVNVHRIVINGKFNPGRLSTKLLEQDNVTVPENDTFVLETGNQLIQDGWDSVDIGPAASFIFRTSDEYPFFPINTIVNNGTLLVYDPITITGKQLARTESIFIGPGALLHLTKIGENVENSKNITASDPYHKIFAMAVTVHGGSLAVQTLGFGSGWRTLDILSSGSVTMRSSVNDSHEVIVNHISVTGIINILLIINIY